MKKHIAISTFIILLSISTALPSHALADTGQTRSDIRPAETTDNTSAYDRITTAEIVLASMFAISSAGCISLYRRKNTAPDNRPDAATHTTVTSPADDTPPDADTADTVSDGIGLTATPSEQTVPTELLHKIIDFGLAHSDSHQKISECAGYAVAVVDSDAHERGHAQFGGELSGCGMWKCLFRQQEAVEAVDEAWVGA